MSHQPYNIFAATRLSRSWTCAVGGLSLFFGVVLAQHSCQQFITGNGKLGGDNVQSREHPGIQAKAFDQLGRITNRRTGDFVDHMNANGDSLGESELPSTDVER